jgi:hypothetical protein
MLFTGESKMLLRVIAFLSLTNSVLGYFAYTKHTSKQACLKSKDSDSDSGSDAGSDYGSDAGSDYGSDAEEINQNTERHFFTKEPKENITI